MRHPLSAKARVRIEEVKELFENRGTRALEDAKFELLHRTSMPVEIRRALTSFMKRWQDLARPSLISLACEVVGGEPKVTFPLCKAMVLIGGAIDIHDDIIDESLVKGHKLTLLGKFGRDVAVLAGDALMVKGFSLLHGGLRSLPEDKSLRIIQVIEKLLFELMEGETEELRYRKSINVTPQEYLKAVEKKAADVEAYTRVGAILGGGREDEIEALGKYGRFLGMLAILRDDLADMLDFNGEMLHRLKKETLPMPLVLALHDPEVRKVTASIIRRKNPTPKDASSLLEAASNAKGLEDFQKLMKRLADNALRSIEQIREGKEILKGLVLATYPYAQSFSKPDFDWQSKE